MSLLTNTNRTKYHLHTVETAASKQSKIEGSLLWGLFRTVPTLIVYTGPFPAPKSKKLRCIKKYKKGDYEFDAKKYYWPNHVVTLKSEWCVR